MKWSVSFQTLSASQGSAFHATYTPPLFKPPFWTGVIYAWAVAWHREEGRIGYSN